MSYSEVQARGLSEFEMGNIISAIGNNEAKLLLLCGMNPEIIYSKADLHRKFMEMQGDYPAWIPSPHTTFAYCARSLSPIGLVTTEILNTDLSAYGFIRTDYGLKGVALAGHLLPVSERHENTSLYQLFGNTNAPIAAIREIAMTSEGEIEYRNRSPIIRSKIFWELVTASSSLTVGQLTAAIGEDEGKTSSHLKKLADNNIITRDSQDLGQAYSYYYFNKEAPDGISTKETRYRNDSTLLSCLYEIFSNNPDDVMSYDNILEQLHLANPVYKDQNAAYIIRRISSYLAIMETREYLKRKKFRYDHHSEIGLTEEQRNLLVEVVDILDRFQRQDTAFLEEGMNKAFEISNNPKRVSALIRKAKESSPYT